MAALTNFLRRLLGSSVRPGLGTPGVAGPLASPDSDRAHKSPQSNEGDPGGRAYPGDFRGTPDVTYAPNPDGKPDPGEVVWAWVPYEEDHSKGKDRPVLLIGRDGEWLLGLPLTSKDHDRDAEQEHRAGRDWVDIGSGGWDRSGRPSEVRVNRVLRLDPNAIRREGAVLDEARFHVVAAALSGHH